VERIVVFGASKLESTRGLDHLVRSSIWDFVIDLYFPPFWA
jgi:hypothetical protein